MEEKANEAKTPSPEPKSEPQSKKSDPFSLIGKLAAAAVIILILVGGGYFLGTKLAKNNNSNQANTNPTPTVTTTPAAMQESPTASPSGPVVNQTQVKAGGVTGVSFSAYTVSVPADWTSKDDKTAVSDKLTITKGPVSLVITQAAIGGGGCLYPDNKPSEMAQTFTDFVGITGSAGQLRRSFNKSDDPTINYTICQQGPDGSFGSPTLFGAMNAMAPASVSTQTLSELDAIIASIKKQ